MRSELKAKILFAIVVGLVSTSFGFVQAKVNGVTWNYGVSGDVAVLSVFTNYYYNGRSVHRAIEAMFLSEIPDDIVIPSRLGGYPVGIIRNGSFSHCTESRSVYIPSSVTNIEVGAFSGCSNIRSITIPQCLCDGRLPSMFGSYKSITNINFSGTIKEIGNDAFSGCTGLVGITIPNSVTNIGNNAFSGCSNLTSVTIGNSKVSIGDGAFYDCCNLASDDGFVIVRNVLYRYCGGDENIGIPDGVIRIGTSAFAGCTQLVGITIPNSVTSIGDKSFSGCAGLTGITIPNSVTNIDAAAFAGCSALSNATLPWDILLKFETISSDGWSLLSMDADGTEEYQSVPINNSAATSMSLTLTGPYDFVFSWKVSSERGYDYLSWDLDSTEKARISGTSSTWQKVFVSVPTGKHTIKWTYSKDSSSASGFDCGWVRIPRRRRVAEMFPDSYSTLRAVTLTGTTTTIPDYAFDGCASLSAIDIPPMVTNVGASAFSGCSTLTSLMIPNSVTSIGESAFYNCSGLTSVTIPYSVTGIGEGAFSGCSGLTNVTFYGDAPAGILGSSVLSCATSVRYRKKYAESYEPFVPVSKFGGYVSTAEDIIDLVGCSVSYDDDSPWVDDYDVSHDGEGSMRSGRIENADSTWIETTVNGAGQLSFWWKASSEGYDGDVFDYAYLSVDGVPQGSLGEYKLQGVAIGGKTGWTNVVFDVMEAGPHTIRWTYCKDEVDESDVGSDCVWLDEVSFDPLVSLSFTLDGGEGTVPDSMAKFAQTKIVLPAADRFSKAKHRFGGWSDGVNTYGAGAEYVVPDSNVVFSAAWAANTLVAPVVTSADVADGGTLTTAFATIRITAEAGASIHYTMDGSEPTAESALYTEPFTTDGQMVMIRAVAVKEDYFDSPVTEFSFTRKPFSVAECLNVEDRKVSTGDEDTAWFRVLDAAAHDGEAALRSGVIGDSGTSSVEMTVRGAGEISFWWKVSSEISRNRKYDYVSFLIDGEEQSWLGGEVEWTNEVFAVSGEGAHTLKWVYQKNDNGLTDGEDCAWLDDVTWTSVGVDSYFVEFDACGGEATLASMVLERGSALGILPDAERSCYEFVGWYTAASGGTKVSADTTVTADVTYYAHWQINSYTVTFDVNGGSLGVASPTTRNVAHGAAVGELPDVTRTGYSFVGWYTEAEGGTKISADTTVTADVTYYAHWRYVEVPDDSTIVFNTEETYETEADGSLLFNLTELVGSTSTPKITVKGLPTGLKFDAKTGAITGKATKPGVYKVTVSATNATVKKPVTATFEISVPNFTTELFEAGGLDTTGKYELMSGVVPAVAGRPPYRGINEVVATVVEGGWKLAVSGLPSGLKYDAKNNNITGAASKEGFYTVTFTATKGSGKTAETQIATATFEVVFPTLTLEMAAWDAASATNNCKVTGGGRYPFGKKVTLKATPAKGSVFVGWRETVNSEEGIGNSDGNLSQAASYAYVTTGEDVTLTAVFATETEDVASLKIEVEDVTAAADGTVGTLGADGKYALDLSSCVTSLSQPKLAVSGLPTGVKYDAKTMKITGQATKPGVYTVKVAATNTSVKKATDASTATFKITVPNFTCDALPNLRPETDAYGIVQCGVLFDPDRIKCTPANGWTVKVAGLPTGLKYDAKTGKITGVPTAKAGSYTVTFTASKKGEANQVATITLNIEALPDWVVGTFNGDGIYKPIDLWHGYAEYDFVFTVTVAASGKVSGSITVDVTAGKQEKATFSAVSALGYDESAHVVLWWDWSSELGWHEGMTFDGPAYYYDVDIKLGGKTATRRLYVCDMLDGITSDVGRKVEGVAVAGFDYIEYMPWQDIVFCGDAMKNLWTDKAYTGPLPKFVSSTVTKTVVTEDGDVCTFSFKQNGSVAVKIKRTNGQSDSASFTLEVVPHDGGTWFTADGNWIFPKGSIADVDMVLSPNEKGVITADGIKITDIDVDIDD